MERTFTAVNVLVLPFWLLMIVLPRWRWTYRLMQSPLIVAPLLILYAILLLPHLPEILPLVLNPTLPAIAGVLGTPEGALVGWVHFVAFDLFVGRWVYLDSQAHSINAWLMAPVMLVLLLIGPFGLLLYLGLRGLQGARKGETRSITEGERA